MIGSGLIKLARENGMTVWGGVAYGSLRGYAVTMSEGMGYKKIDFAVSFPDSAGREALRQQLAGEKMKSLYRITNISIGQRAIQVTFYDNPGTMKRLRSFLNWFIPRLEEYGATGAQICAECGEPITAGCWVQVHGVCYHMHESCARQVQQAVDGPDAESTQKEGSYFTGALGALLGALLGAFLWTSALLVDSSALRNVAAAALGWLTERGYRLTKGRPGSGRIWIIALAVALGVVLGAAGPEAIEIGALIANGTLEGFHLWEVPLFLLAMVLEDSAFAKRYILNLISGGIFSVIGLAMVLQQTSRTGFGKKFCYMK